MRVDVVAVSREQIDEALAQAKAVLPAEIFERISTVVRAYSTLVQVVENKATTIGRLRRMLFGPSSEKSRKVLALQGSGQAENSNGQAQADGKAKASCPPPPGRGRNGQDAYRGAKTESVAHHKLNAGDCCPGCRKGKVYEQRG